MMLDNHLPNHWQDLGQRSGRGCWCHGDLTELYRSHCPQPNPNTGSKGANPRLSKLDLAVLMELLAQKVTKTLPGAPRVCVREGPTPVPVTVTTSVTFPRCCAPLTPTLCLCVPPGHRNPQHSHPDGQDGVCASQGGGCAGGRLRGRRLGLGRVQIR